MNRFWTCAAAIALLCGAVPAAFGADAAEPAVAPAPQAESSDPSVHLNYASILFYKGRHLFQTGGDVENGKVIFKDVERHLREALRLVAQDQDPVRRQLIESQTAFLLGDVYLFVWKDELTARTFYEQALTAYPEHDGAREALKSIDLQRKLKP